MHSSTIIYFFLTIVIILSQPQPNVPEDTVKLTFLKEKGNDKTLQKGDSIHVTYDEYMITFNSEDFKEGEEMYFKIKAEEYAFYDYEGYDGIYYQYIDGDHGYDERSLMFTKYQFKTNFEYINDIKYKIQYFTIKKNKNEFRGTNGNLLLIYFMIDYGFVEITNTLEDEGKLKTWEIVLIVIACVLVVAFIIIYICYRRKKELAMANAGNGQAYGTDQYGQYNQPYPPAQYQY